MHYLLFGLFTLSLPLAADEMAAAEPLPISVLLLLLLVFLFVYMFKLKIDLHKMSKQQPAVQQAVQAPAPGFYALHDDISGLPNKRLLQQQVDARLQDIPEQTGSLLLLRIDSFEQVNQRLGYRNSNLLLAQVGQQINEWLTDEDDAFTFEQRQTTPVRLAHLGGADFAIWLKAEDGEQLALSLFKQLTQQLSLSVTVEQQQISYALLAGIADYPAYGPSVDDLLERAYQQLYCLP